MTKKLLHEAILERPLLGDGAMGTQLMIAGLAQAIAAKPGTLRILNGCSPSSAITLTRDQNASSPILRGSRIMLTRHGELDHVVEINKAGVKSPARRSAAKPSTKIVAMCWATSGPSAVSWFRSANSLRRRCKPLLKSRPAPRRWRSRCIIIETQTGLEELGIAINAAKTAGAKCIIGSMAYDVTLDGTTFRTMMGIDPERAAEFMEEHGAHICRLELRHWHGDGSAHAWLWGAIRA